MVALPWANPSAAFWNPKSRVACSLALVVYWLVKVGEESYTSPNMKKSSLPLALAWSSTDGMNCCQNSVLTCLTVSMRNPSMPRSAHVW